MILETKDEKQIFIYDMAYPKQYNIDTKPRDKLTRYRQFPSETKERRSGYTVTIIPVIIGALVGGMKRTMNKLTKLLTKQELVVKTVAEM